MWFPAKTEEKGQIETLPMIDYEDIAKLDLRVGKVLLAGPVKKLKSSCVLKWISERNKVKIKSKFKLKLKSKSKLNQNLPVVFMSVYDGHEQFIELIPKPILVSIKIVGKITEIDPIITEIDRMN